MKLINNFRRLLKGFWMLTCRTLLNISKLIRLLLVGFMIAGCSYSHPDLSSRSSVSIQPVVVDSERYMGRWYIIGNIPYWHEKQFIGSFFQWELRSDGRINDTYVGYTSGVNGKMKRFSSVDQPISNGGGIKWTVCFDPLSCITRQTLFVDKDYQFTIVGTTDKSLGWILARKPKISDNEYQMMLFRLDALGFDINQFTRVPQIVE